MNTVNRLPYREFLARRRKLISQIQTAERLYQRTIDARYTPLSSNGRELVTACLQRYREELDDLAKTFRESQTIKGVE